LWQRPCSQRSSNKSSTFRFALWHSKIVSFLLLISWLYSSSLDIHVTSVQLPHMSCTLFWISKSSMYSLSC
jgi:hypothetical protein